MARFHHGCRFPRRARLALFLAFCAAFAGIPAPPAPARAAEPRLQFLEGLRSRGYYDVAIEYLDALSTRGDLPPDITQRLPYERALTLLEASRELTNSRLKREQLDAAQAAFEQFVQSAPDHPLAAQANTQRARILMEKARVEIWDAEDPANAENRGTFQSTARVLIKLSRTVFQAALTRHDAAFRAFPLMIPEDESVRRRERETAEQRYLQALLDVAECTYWEAQTHDRGGKVRNDLLEQAAAGYAAIHAQHRSQVAGLMSRLWQGKCFEEMDRIGEALGIYNEFLKHEGTSDAMLDLQARALRFRLICLNHETRKEYRVVVDEANAWRSSAGRLAHSEVGIGILYELARALEALGSDRKLPEAERTNYLTQALAHGRQIARYSGELKAPALALVRRATSAMGRAADDPKNFNEAFGIGSQFASETSSLRAEYERAAAANAPHANDLRESVKARAAEMTRMFDLALRLATEDADPQNVSLARLQLAFGYFMQERYYESAAAADYVALHLAPEFDEMARKAAFMEMAAYNYAYAESEPAQRDFEEAQTVAAAERLVGRWPDSDDATVARNTIAKMFFNAGDKARAAEWWAQVPATAPDYSKSQIQAGQAYWAAYSEQTSLPEDERVPAETFDAWRAAAEQYLVRGINSWQAQLPDQAATPNDLVLGKITLSQMRNLSGIHESTGETIGAIDLLIAEPHAVLDAVAVPAGESRPKDPTDVRSAKIAGFAWQQLLRAYIGIRNLEAAADAREKLEQVAAGDDSASLTQVYIAFGQELQRELEQLRVGGETARLDEVRAGFQEFLDSIYQREQGQTFGSLLWISETFTSLAEGSDDDPAKAEEFFRKASETYRKLLDKAEGDPAFLTSPEQKTVISLRLAECLRRQGDYAAAEEVLLGVVRESPTAPNVQFEVAKLYQAWGAGDAKHADKFLIALNGRNDPPLWGWGGLIRRLQNALRSREDPRIAQLHSDARYNQADAYRLYGLQQSSSAERLANLDRARLAVEVFSRIAVSLPPQEFKRFDALYQQIRRDLGQPEMSLALVVGRESPTSPPTDNNGTRQAPAQAALQSPGPAETSATTDDQPRTNYMVIVVLVVVGASTVAGLYYFAWMQSNKKRRRFVRSAAKSTSRGSKSE